MKNAVFIKLHDHCQTLAPKVNRNDIIGSIKDLTGEKIQVVKTDLDTSVIRGYFLSADNVDHPFVKKTGRNVIVLSRDLNDCWSRFVNVKEAMHLLDDDKDLSDTAAKFERLVSDLSAPTVDRAPQTMSDLLAIWMALACFCPEKSRLEFQDLLSRGQIDNYQIALTLKIPEYYVPQLFLPVYPTLVGILRGEITPES